MKYVAIILLALLGILEFILRATVVLCSFLVILLIYPEVLEPWCFKMAERVLDHG